LTVFSSLKTWLKRGAPFAKDVAAGSAVVAPPLVHCGGTKDVAAAITCVRAKNKTTKTTKTTLSLQVTQSFQTLNAEAGLRKQAWHTHKHEEVRWKQARRQARNMNECER